MYIEIGVKLLLGQRLPKVQIYFIIGCILKAIHLYVNLPNMK